MFKKLDPKADIGWLHVRKEKKEEGVCYKLKGHDTAQIVNPEEYLSTIFNEDRFLNTLKRHEI